MSKRKVNDPVPPGHIAKCSRCGNTKWEELNTEASVHHRSPVTCYDQKSCGRRAVEYADALLAKLEANSGGGR